MIPLFRPRSAGAARDTVLCNGAAVCVRDDVTSPLVVNVRTCLRENPDEILP